MTWPEVADNLLVYCFTEQIPECVETRILRYSLLELK